MKTKDGHQMGSFDEVRQMGKPQKIALEITDLTIDDLNREINRRKKIVPFVEHVNMIVKRAEDKKVKIKPDKIVYELQHDIIGRPNMFLGYNLSDMPVEDVLKEDEDIRNREVPRCNVPRKVVWTDRLVIHEETGRVIDYATAGTAESEERSVDDLIERIGRAKKK